ncbi:hypothetical protein ACI2KX_03465 [Ectopseudomonas khazarica]|uniref:hypothetical protein n=1 Tax=Ectopseudomonas khazarica TaxID=2502979 RepID=UPI0038514F94
MNDVLESLKETLRERLSSPLIGPYFIAFVLCNYKAFLFVFSGLTPAEKIIAIDALYSGWLGVLTAFGAPLFFALFYVFLYPFPARYIMQFTLHQNRLNRAVQQKVLEETPMTISESQDLIKRHKTKVSDLELESERHRESSDRWKELAISKDSEIKTLNENIDLLNDNLELGQDRQAELDKENSELQELLEGFLLRLDEIYASLPVSGPTTDVVMSDGKSVKMTYSPANEYIAPGLREAIDNMAPLYKKADDLLGPRRRKNMKAG